jgi:hypothetical protein
MKVKYIKPKKINISNKILNKKYKTDNNFIKNFLILIFYTILLMIFIFLLLNYKNNFIENFSKISSDMLLDTTIPNLINGNTITIHREPNVKLISGDKISGRKEDEKKMIFPSLFYFPYKNYIGNLHFYKYKNSSEIPDFILNNVRLMTTNFNTNDNYLFYVSLKTINNYPLIYDLLTMDFKTGNMISINSNSELRNCYITLDKNNYMRFNDNKQLFDVEPNEKYLELTGTIESGQDDILKIFVSNNELNKNEKYYIKFIQDVDIQLNNYKNTIKNNNFGLYKNFNIII